MPGFRSRGGGRGGGQRGSFRARGRGRGGGGRGRRGGRRGGGGRGDARSGRTTKRAFEDDPQKEITTAADAASMSAGSDSDEDEDENENGSDSDSDADGDGDGDGARLSAYDALLASLAEVEKPEPQERKRKRRKLEHTATNDDDDKPSTAIEDEGGALDDAYEEDEEEEEQIAPEEANEEEENPADPFESHFSAPSPTFLARASAAKNNTWRSSAQIRPGLGRAVVAVPQGAEEEKERVKEGQWHLKKKLAHNTVPLPPLAQEVFAYRDVLYTQRTVENADDVRRLYVLHALNHVFKTRDRVLKNNAKLGGKGEGDAEVELRDQGFTRPKVLILLPTRNSAAKVVEAIAQCIDVDQQENRKRFQDSFHLPPDQDPLPPNKPVDFLELFSGNTDDAFKLGLKLTRKTLKYFSAFYSSDIIIASPLGLTLAFGGDNPDSKGFDRDFLSSIELLVLDQADALQQQNWAHVRTILSHMNQLPRDAHGCDISRVRPWYLDGLARCLRQTLVCAPFATPVLLQLFNTSLNLAGRLKTVPEILPSTAALDRLATTTLAASSSSARQLFSRFPAASTPAGDPDARWEFFRAAVIPSLQRSSSSSSGAGGGVLVVVPSYLEFVRVRNGLSAALENAAGVEFAAVSEQSDVRDVSRARSHFANGRLGVLLYTFRAHHFWRYRLRGVNEVVLYQLPDNPVFYEEVVAMMVDGGAGGGVGGKTGGGGGRSGGGRTPRVRALFSPWDRLALERVVGTKRAATMCSDKGDTFEFV